MPIQANGEDGADHGEEGTDQHLAFETDIEDAGLGGERASQRDESRMGAVVRSVATISETLRRRSKTSIAAPRRACRRLRVER
jgi:hypothetical protein